MRAWRLFVCAVLLVIGAGACRATAGSGIQVIKTGDNYKVLAGTPEAAKGKLVIEIHALGKWKFEAKAPILIDIRSPAPVKLGKRKLRKDDAAGKEPGKRRFEVDYQAPAGTHRLGLKFDFVICTDTLCQKKRFDLTYPLSSG